MPRRFNYWLPATVIVLLAVAAPLPHRQLLSDTGSHALHHVATILEAPTQAMADSVGAWATAAQRHAVKWKQQAWEFTDMVCTYWGKKATP